MHSLLKALEGQLIVSCQAWEGDAFRDSGAIARFAKAAVDGGAVAIRANGTDDIVAIRRTVNVPVIGINKEVHADGRILITPTFESAAALHRAGAAVIALDCTVRGQSSGALERIREIKSRLGALVFADIATEEEAIAAAEAGADAVLSTLRGYTEGTADIKQFEPEFIRSLVQRLKLPVIAEGRIHTPQEAQVAITAGAFTVIVGTAITRPTDLTKLFVRAVDRAYRTRTETRYFVGVDLGGTNTKYGIVSSQGQLLWSGLMPTPAHNGREALLAAVDSAVTTTQRQADTRGLRLAAVGVATAGWVNPHNGTIAYATENLPGWTGTKVAEHVAATCKLPVVVENDANALAMGEKYFGTAKQLNDFAVITLGTGVGGGCYINGQLNRGSHFFANSFGHIPLVPDGLPCTCGRKGCLEVYANAMALLRYAGPSFTSVQQVIAAAKQGDLQTVTAIRTLSKYVAIGCASLVGLLDPQAIILSGGLATENALLIDSLREELQPLVPSWEQRNLQVCGSKLGYYGGVFGAAALGAALLATSAA